MGVRKSVTIIGPAFPDSKKGRFLIHSSAPHLLLCLAELLGRGAAAAVRDDPVAHRPPAGTTHTGMSRARAVRTGLTGETRVMPELEQHVQAQSDPLAAALATTAPTACEFSVRNMRIPL